MYVLLPPSEAKAGGGTGKPLGRRAPASGDLATARERVLTAVQQLCTGDPERAAVTLKLPASAAAAALDANRRVMAAPTRPAIERFAGVVYAALDAGSLSPQAGRLARTKVLIFSGAFGVLSGGEPVPDHRVPAGAVLPGVGPLPAFWRPVLARVLPELLGSSYVIDLRSTDYAGLWQPGPAQRRRTLTVRVLSELTAPGARPVHRVISHPSKAAKGRLARTLLEAAGRGAPARCPEQVAALAEALGWRTELQPGAGGGTVLEIVLPPPT